jgi:phosphoglycerate dehydrogenase-like enzyme
MKDNPVRIVFHGENAGAFHAGFADLLGKDAEIALLPDALDAEADRATYEAADVIVATRFTALLPTPVKLKLFLVPGAGTDAVDVAALPAGVTVCNCFGHEAAIAEYVMAAILSRVIPMAQADAELRQERWTWWAGTKERAHGEICGKTIGLLGYGHIGKAIAARAHAFGMIVHTANRSAVSDTLVDRAFTLDELEAFYASADIIVVSLPLVEQTRSLVNAAAFADMRKNAVLINVGRGPVVDEAALFEALTKHQIAGAVIDTWYHYPAPGTLTSSPASLPFHTLPNVMMTPHMSGWTEGTISRRQATMAENIQRLREGRELINVVRG